MNQSNLLHPRDQIVMIMERIYGYGMTTTSGGNLSIIDDNGDIWITPSGIDKGSLTRNDILCVKPDGTVVGPHKPSVELPFHSQVYQMRPDVKAVLHAHPPALVAFSIARTLPDTSIIPNAHLVCGEVAMAEYAIPGSDQLGQNIAKHFATGLNTVMLENHGIVCAGKSLFEAFMRFETLDFCARLLIKSHALDNPVGLDDSQLAQFEKKQPTSLDEFIPNGYSSKEREARRVMCDLIHRAYDQMLFTSTQGTFSSRLGDDSFIITPYGVDRKYIEPRDLVRIDHGWREAGKHPSRSVLLHQKIYQEHSDINTVMIAHPPNIMAFGITHTPFDTRTIPESYIMLRDVPSLPYGTNVVNQDLLVNTLGPAVPLVLIENDCVVVTGSSLLNAFDRLEVAEFSAKAVVAARSIGPLVKIDEDEVIELEKDFKLPPRKSGKCAKGCKGGKKE